MIQLKIEKWNSCFQFTVAMGEKFYYQIENDSYFEYGQIETIMI